MFPQRFRRNGLRTAAALAAAVIGVGLAALPAQAEEAPFDISTQAGPPYGEFFYADGGAEAQSAYFLVSLQSDGELVAIDNLHVEFGIDDLGGELALAIDRPQCTGGGAVVTCDFDGLAFTDFIEELVFFDITVGPGVAAGDRTDYSITVEADDYDPQTFGGTWTFYEPGSTDFQYEIEAPDRDGVEPGTEFTPEVAFSNVGDDTHDGIYLQFDVELQYRHYLSFAADYGNCGTTDFGTFVCKLDDITPAPGETYELDADTPITMALGEGAPGPLTYLSWFRIYPMGFELVDEDEIDFFDSDRTLGFSLVDRDPVAGDPSTPLEFMEVRSADHAYDLAVDDQDVEAEAGEEFALEIPVENLGPADAWPRPHPGADHNQFQVTVQLPSGLELGESDEHGRFIGEGYSCFDTRHPDHQWFNNTENPADYGVDHVDTNCWITLELIEPGDEAEIKLPVTAEDAAPSTDGRVVAQTDTFWWDWAQENGGITEDHYQVLDSDLDNNTAQLTLNAPEGRGQLPKTGASTVMFAGAAASALAAGIALLALARRRQLRRL